MVDQLFTIGMSFFETLLLRTRMWDINAQPTLFSRSAYAMWQEPPKDFSLDLFAYFQAKSASLNVERLPVHFGKRKFGEAHWKTGITALIKFIRRTLSYSWSLRQRMIGDQ